MGLDKLKLDYKGKDKEDNAVVVSPIELLYWETKSILRTEDEVLNDPHNNITDVLYDEIAYAIKNESLINWQINGKTTGGKSVTGITIRDAVLDEIARQKDKKFDESDKYSLIISDQTELIRFYESNPEWTCVEVDEDNTLANTGMNATVESQMDIQYSNIFAQRFVHKIRCSPSGIQDINCYLVIEMVGKDIRKATNRGKVYYRDIQTGRNVLLGFCDIYVGDTLKKEYYLKYRKKKFLRMDLLQSHGIRDIRELEFAGIVVEGVLELKNIARINKVPLATITVKLQEIIRKHKKVYSMITSKELEVRVKGILDNYSEMKKIEEGIKNERDRERSQVLIEVRDELEKIYTDAIKEEGKKVNLYTEYSKIE